MIDELSLRATKINELDWKTAIYSVAARGDYIATGDSQGDIAVICATTGQKISKTNATIARVFTVQWVQNNVLLYGCDNGVINFFDIRLCKNLPPLIALNDDIVNFVLLDQSKMYVAAGNQVYKYQLVYPNQKLLYESEEYDFEIYSMCLINQGKNLVYATSKGLYFSGTKENSLELRGLYPLENGASVICGYDDRFFFYSDCSEKIQVGIFEDNKISHYDTFTSIPSCEETNIDCLKLNRTKNWLLAFDQASCKAYLCDLSLLYKFFQPELKDSLTVKDDFLDEMV